MAEGNHKRIKVSNQLVLASQPLKLGEKRLLAMLIAKVDDSNINQFIEISAKEYSKLYGVEMDGCYKAMKRAEQGLWDAEIWFSPDDKCRWVTRCKYQKQEGKIQLKIHEDLREHVSGLNEYYTSYLLKVAGEFSTVYSWRLLELLMRFRKTGLYRPPSLDEFHTLMGVPDAYRARFNLFRTKALNVPLKEIRAAGINVVMELKKSGRKVTGIEFRFPREQQSDWVNNTSKDKMKRSKAQPEAPDTRPVVSAGEQIKDINELKRGLR